MYDLLLKNARIVDPKNKIDEICDIGIKNGKIINIGAGIASKSVSDSISLSGKIAIPGIIDPHVHVSSWIGGPQGYKMMAKAGVITAIDFAGPIEDIIKDLPKKGKGMNIAVLNALRPGINIACNNPSKLEIEQFIDSSLEKGAIGIKILGGHYPLTPSSTFNTIKSANKKRVYVAFHVGTKESSSDLTGFREAVAMAKDNSVHIAHINSYCRGLVKAPQDELREIFSLLEGNKHIISESYLGLINGTSGKCTGDKPDSDVTKNCLKMGGFPPTRNGLEQAILSGFALVNNQAYGENVLLDGTDGVNTWIKADTDITVSFKVNVPEVLFLSAISKDRDGKFLVDAFSTDGGGIPRNVTVEKGLALVKFGALTMEEFVIKSSLNPARMFGMVNKGHLGIGADADITVLDLEIGKAIMGISNGNIIMINSIVIGEGGTLLVTKHGVENAKKANIDYKEIDLNHSLLYDRK